MAKGQVEGQSREASGLCLDFVRSSGSLDAQSQSDAKEAESSGNSEEKVSSQEALPSADGASAIYFAGTEDGLIQKCSVSYKDGPLEIFHGHTGPVYKIRCSPFYSDAFLSCSADWTCALWSQNTGRYGNSPVLSFQSVQGHSVITDIGWSPTNSTVFGVAGREGRIELWDLEFSPLDPRICHTLPQGKRICSLLFSNSAPVLLVGTADGSIDVYQIQGIDLGLGPSAQHVSKWQPSQQRIRLDESMRKHNDLQKAQRSMAAASTSKAGESASQGAQASPLETKKQNFQRLGSSIAVFASKDAMDAHE